MEKIRVGIAGLGGRGMWTLQNILCVREDVEVTYLCELYEDRLAEGKKHVMETCGNTPLTTMDYREMVTSDLVDTVVITTAWEAHVPIAVATMYAGKDCSCEVGGAYSVEDCWRLVRAHEETGRHCMMVENCCFNREELMVLNMVKQGLFGKVVHCDGAYMHDLKYEIANGDKLRHYRLRNFMNRNCDNYPTHELGPIAKVLNINNGNRMVSLNAVASGAWALNEYAKEHDEVDPALRDHRFAQGDIVHTNIICAGGETISLTLNNTLPGFYSRNFTVRGTKGMYSEDAECVFLEGVHCDGDHSCYGNRKEYYEQYEHRMWRETDAAAFTGGHGGMDWLVYGAYFDAVKRGITPPIDTYDMATWMSISPLSEESIRLGGAAVTIPDFTGGRWTHRTGLYTGFYDLNS